MISQGKLRSVHISRETIVFIPPVPEMKNPFVCNHAMVKSSIDKVKECILKSLVLSEIFRELDVQVLKILV